MVHTDKAKIGVLVRVADKNAAKPAIGRACIYCFLFFGQIPSKDSEQAIGEGIAQTHHQRVVFHHFFYCCTFCWPFYEFAVAAS
jgi:hypothetical protein